MKLSTVLLTSVALQAGFAGWCFGAAHASDLAVKVPPIPYVQPYNWSGMYLGIEGGAVFEAFALNGLNTAVNTNPTSWQIGGDIEALHQFQGSNWVMGVIADLDYGHSTMAGSSATYWRGKGDVAFGYSFGPVLWLVKGGVAGERTGTQLLGVGANLPAYGWNAGTQLEWQLTQHLVWKVIDYNFVSLNGLQLGPISLNNSSNEIKTGFEYKIPPTGVGM
jgi:hypothetical protein